jgi:hypothetical protein
MRLYDVNLFELKRPTVPNVGKDRLCLAAEATVITREQRDSASVLQQSVGDAHFVCLAKTITGRTTARRHGREETESCV